MSIGKAWCNEVNKLVDIVQACQLYEGHPDYPRLKGQDLTFLCPDDDCRKLKKPTVSAVNYRVEKGKREKRPHFRVTTPENHSDSCFIVDRQLALDELRQERKEAEAEEKKGKIREVRPPAEISVFEPASSDVDSDHLGLTPDVENAIKALKPGRVRTDGLKRVQKERPTSTMRLHEVVSWLEVLDNENKNTYRPLRVGNRPARNFQDCFRPIKQYEPGTDADYFFHGLVRVIQYGAANFAVRFLGKTMIDGVSYNASFYIPYEKLEAYRYRKEMINLLKKVAIKPNPSNKYPADSPTAYCYFYGKSVLEFREQQENPPKQDLNIKIEHLHSVTFREERYPSKKSIKK